ncbi:hypothetical protein Tco_0339380 [Tanacetum coccineum]
MILCDAEYTFYKGDEVVVVDVIVGVVIVVAIIRVGVVVMIIGIVVVVAGVPSINKLSWNQPDSMSDELVIAETAKVRRFYTPVVNGYYL